MRSVKLAGTAKHTIGLLAGVLGVVSFVAAVGLFLSVGFANNQGRSPWGAAVTAVVLTGIGYILCRAAKAIR